jgi:hypothetical protein
MKLKIDLKKIVNNYNLCITKNPYGIKRLWPNSYIELFYNKFFNHIYNKIKSPNILEINQSNNNNLILWRKCFKNSRIDNYKNEDINKHCKFKYDVIIISDRKKLEGFNSIQKLIKILNYDGTIVFENIGMDLKFIFKLFFKYYFKYNLFIMDFRLHRFRSNNCILSLNNSKKSFFFKEKFLSFLSLTKFFIFESVIYLLVKILKK